MENRCGLTGRCYLAKAFLSIRLDSILPKSQDHSFLSIRLDWIQFFPYLPISQDHSFLSIRLDSIGLDSIPPNSQDHYVEAAADFGFCHGSPSFWLFCFGVLLHWSFLLLLHLTGHLCMSRAGSSFSFLVHPSKEPVSPLLW